MLFDNNVISKLFDSDVAKANQLYLALSRNTPKQASTALRINTNLTNQLLYVSNGKINVLSFPTVTTDAAFVLRVIGSHGDEVDNLTPVALQGQLLHQVFSTLVPTAVVNRFMLPVLAADPIMLEPPPPSEMGPGPGRLNVVFERPEDTPLIAAFSATYSLPVGITAPSQAKLDDPATLTTEDFPDEAGIAWVRAAHHAINHHGGKPIHGEPTIFNPADLNLGPFATLDMATNIEANRIMLTPDDQQYEFVLTIARGQIKTRQQVNSIGTSQAANPNSGTALSNQSSAAIAAQMAAIVKAALETSAVINKPKVSRTDTEADTLISDTVARYQLMFASVETQSDPNNPGSKIQVVKLPKISPEFGTILETSKLSEAVRSMQEQFAHHLSKRSESRLNQDTTIDFNVHSLDATTVACLKRGIWNDEQLGLDPKSIQSKFGIYTVAPHSADSAAWKERVEAGRVIFRQETIGEDKSRISAKAHSLDHSGRMITATDLHATIANMWAIVSFITEAAGESEMWKCVVMLQNLWHHTSGKRWLQQNRGTQHLICCLILEVQSVIAGFVEIANCMTYRQAAQDDLGSTLSPKAYLAAMKRARDIIDANYRMINRNNLGDFVMQPLICKQFLTTDRDTATDTATPRTPTTPSANRNRDDAGGRGSGRGGRTNNTPGRDNSNTGRGAGAAGRGAGVGSPRTELTQEQISALKLKGLLKYTGSETRIPTPVDIFETNGASGLTRLCMNHIVRNRYCRWGNTCHMKHINRTNDLTTENRAKFTTFVTNHMHLELANPGTPS